MTINDLILTIDVPGRRLIRDFYSNLEIQPRPLMQGDSYNVRLIAVEPNPTGNISRPWRYLALPTSAYVGVGTPGAAPTSGTFTLTFGADTTAALNYNATAAQVASALNALASITSAGGVTVSAAADGGPYQISFVTAGSRAAITGTADALYPLSTITVYTARDGTVDLTEIQVIVLDRQPAALAETFAAIASPAVTITTLQGGGSGVPEIQRVSLSPDIHDGTFTLSFGAATTAALAWNIAADALVAALEALSTIATGDVAVSGEFPQWDVTFQGALTGNQSAMTGSAAGLIGPQGVEGTLVLATAGIEQLVNGSTAVDTFLEISIASGGAPITLLQVPVTVKNDQIPNAPATGTGFPTYYTVSEVDAGFVPQDDVTTIADAAITVGAALATTAATNSSPYGYTQAQADGLIARVNALIVDVTALKDKDNAILAQLRALDILGT